MSLRLASLSDVVRVQVAAEPDAELRDLRVWLDRTHGVRVSQSVLWKVVARLGLTLKKSTCGRRSRTAWT